MNLIHILYALFMKKYYVPVDISCFHVMYNVYALNHTNKDQCTCVLIRRVFPYLVFIGVFPFL